MSGAVATPTEDRWDSDQHAADGLGHAGGLLGAFHLDGPALGDLPPAVADLVDRDNLHACTDFGSARHRSREAHLVPAVVDPELEAAGSKHVLSKAVDQGQREVAVGDRAPERALLLRTLDVDVDPLVVARDLCEAVDVLLGDLAPAAWPELPAGELTQLVDAVHRHGRHPGQPTPRASPPNRPEPAGRRRRRAARGCARRRHASQRTAA